MKVKLIVSKWSRTQQAWVDFRTYEEEAKRTPKLITLQGIHNGYRFRHDGSYAGKTSGMDLYKYRIEVIG